MKGLLIKDILNMKNYMKQLVLVLIFFIAYGIFLKNGTFVGTMITLMLSMQVITTMSYDEYAKWDKYALTMNINRKDIIISKYIFFTISIIIGIVVGITTSIAINQIAKLDTGMNEIIVTSIVVPCVFAILFSIIIPVVFKTGVEKGRIVMMLILFIPAILVGAIVKISEKANITMPSPSNLEILMKFGVLGLVLLTILAVFISYNQALTERVAFILDQLQIRGFTQWPLVNGAGTVDGEPRMGTHTWPEMNSATMTIVEDEMVPLILKYVKNLDEVNKENGIRAFVWDITDMY